MLQRVTVQELIDKVRLAADQQGTTLRVTDADIMSLLGDALGRYIGQASAHGWSYWLKSKATTLSVGRATDSDGGTDFPFGLAQLSFGTRVRVEGVYRVELRRPGGDWVDLDPIPFSEVNNPDNQLPPDQNGEPRRYWMHGGNFDYPGVIQQLAFTPPADQEYTVRVWYACVQPFDDVTDELEIGVVGGDWWVVWDTVETLAIRDHYPDMAQLAAMKRQQVWVELVHRVNSRNKDRNFTIRDVTGRQRSLAARRWLV